MKNKVTLHNLFYNDRFLMFFSVIAAFVIWVTISMTVGTEIERTIDNVKVNVDLDNSVPKQFNLTMFGEREYTVSVKVKGKRYAVGGLTADDISVTAQTNYVDSVGKHTLALKAVPKNESADFTISSLSSSYIEAYFDVYKEATFPLETDVITSKLMPDGYISEEPILSAKNITVCGPALEVNKINKVYARVEVVNPLTTTATIDAAIVPVNEFGGTLRYVTIKDNPSVTVTLPILKLKELPVTVDFINAPKDYAAYLNTVISPATVKIAAEESYVDKLDKISVGTIDFSKVGALNNRFVFNTADLAEVKFVDGTKEVEVKVDAGKMVTGKFRLDSSNLKINNIPAGLGVTVPDNFSLNVILVGPADVIADISSTDLIGVVDAGSVKAESGSITLPIDISIKNNTSCWAYGDYSVTLGVKKNG